MTTEKKEELIQQLVEKLEKAKLSTDTLDSLIVKNEIYNTRIQESDTKDLLLTALMVFISAGICYVNPINMVTQTFLGPAPEPMAVFGFFPDMIDGVLNLITYSVSFIVPFTVLRFFKNYYRFKGIKVPTWKEQELSRERIQRFNTKMENLRQGDISDIFSLLKLINRTKLVQDKHRSKLMESMCLIVSSYGTKELAYKAAKFAKTEITDEDVYFMSLRDASDKGSLEATKELSNLVVPSNQISGSSLAAGLILGAMIF